MYGSETWVMNPHIGSVFGISHHRVDRRLTGRQPQQVRYSLWTYPPLEYVMVVVGLEEVVTYILCLQNTVAQFIVTRPIMNLCMVAEHRPGHRSPSGGGSMIGWMWRGCGRQFRRQNGRRRSRRHMGQRRQHNKSVGG